VACIMDEVAYWRDETSATPDVEAYRAIVPALITTDGMLVGISTGYRRMGLLHQKHRDAFGQDDGRVLVVQGSTVLFNRALDAAAIAAAKAADPEAAESEWEGGFRDDIAAFLGDDAVDAAVDLERPLELPPRRGIVFHAFCDASGGRGDAYTLCIGHAEGDRFVADVVRGRRPPFDPQEVTSELAGVVKAYGVRKVGGDNYSAAWVETAWRDCGLQYERSAVAKSGLYLEALPHFVRGAVSIPNLPVLVRELRLLERRTSRVGKDVVDHGRTGSDDHANALAGCMYAALGRRSRYDSSQSWVDGSGAARRRFTLGERMRLAGFPV
jgi:hypothetical protein